MDDHMYEFMMGYAEGYLLPLLRQEYEEAGSLRQCEHYGEVQDFCKALNEVAPYAGYEKVSPKKLL